MPASSIPVDKEMSAKLDELDQASTDAQPQGLDPSMFSPPVLKGFVRAVNPVLKSLFTLDELPPDGGPSLGSAITAMCSAVNDAVSAEVLPPELQCSPPRGDDDLTSLAGKLKVAAKSKDFKQFLKEPAPELGLEDTSVPLEQEPAPLDYSSKIAKIS